MDKSHLKTAADKVAITLLNNGYDIYFVGGGVRDNLLNLPVKDIDISTNATPDEVLKLFPNSNVVGESFGVVIVKEDNFNFEVATFRKDGEYVDCRHPESIEFGTIKEDAFRRDFTINTLYQHPVSKQIKDFTGGLKDLKNKVIKCVGDPNKRFEEDALRLLRAIRFASRFDFEIEENTLNAIKKNAHKIKSISNERIREELDRMITGPNPSLALDLLYDTSLLNYILPEVSDLNGVQQSPVHHPEGDVFVHTKLILDCLENRNTINSWACILHDVGKFFTSEIGEDGNIHSNQHHKVGADIARDILTRLRFSSDEIEVITKIVYNHMKPMNIKKMKRSKLRRFLGSEHIESLLEVHLADCLSSNKDLSSYEFAIESINSFKDEPIIPEPLINGNHLIELGLSPGPLFGKLLHKVQTKQLDGEISTTEEAIVLVKELLEERKDFS